MTQNKGIQQNTDNLKLRPRGGLCSISDSLAAMFLKDAIKKGYGLEIPSLGIKIEGTVTKIKGENPVARL